MVPVFIVSHIISWKNPAKLSNPLNFLVLIKKMEHICFIDDMNKHVDLNDEL